MRSSNHAVVYEGNNMDKLHNLTHYIISKCDDSSRLGATKLNKILWYSDALSYLYNGKPITDAKYEKRQFGPVPKGIMSVRNELKTWGYVFEKEAMNNGYPQTQFISLEHPDISDFTPENISLVDGLIKTICDSHTATSISNHSHDIIWDAAEIGEEIPLYAILASRQGELSGEDMDWARSQATTLRLM